MLTKLTVRNFKRFDSVEIELGQAVVFIGPNNSGKTTALQALALWQIGLRRWTEKRKGRTVEKRPGVTVNRRDLVSIPVPDANLLWRDLHVRNITQVMKDGKPSPRTKNVNIEVIVDGVTLDKPWSCGLEFDYANDESFYCRPLRMDEVGTQRMAVPDEAEGTMVAFLPPMSGLADREYMKQAGEISVLIGQGQTAQVLRNLCFQIYSESQDAWKELVDYVRELFGVELLPQPTSSSEAKSSCRIANAATHWDCRRQAAVFSRRCSCWRTCTQTLTQSFCSMSQMHTLKSYASGRFTTF